MWQIIPSRAAYVPSVAKALALDVVNNNGVLLLWSLYIRDVAFVLLIHPPTQPKTFGRALSDRLRQGTGAEAATCR